MISLNRDNILRFVAEPDFFVKNPGMQPIAQQMTDCNNAFAKSAAEKGCRCRADTSLLTPCVTAFIRLLVDAKQSNSSIVTDFVKYAAKKDQIDGIAVTIYFSDLNGGSTLQRYEFP
ncbi:MAG: hypothetical protein EBV45_01145 [Chloroflexi bacterium]|nr:hypothetical protein [Chloroflexota bacterium]